MKNVTEQCKKIENFLGEIFHKKKKIFFLKVFGLFTIAFLVLSPTLHFRVGNTFFGGVSFLYNVRLAQFFFTRAAYPLIGQSYPYAHYQLSRTYFIQGELETSLEEARIEIEMYPEHARTHYILGLTLGYMNREVEAIEEFGKFIEYKPESWAARNDRAWLQFRIGDIEGALETITPVVGNIGNSWVQNTYGTLLLNKERYGEARWAFENAKRAVDEMTVESWGSAYPGNDPRIYETGLQAMRVSIENNLKLLGEIERK